MDFLFDPYREMKADVLKGVAQLSRARAHTRAHDTGEKEDPSQASHIEIFQWLSFLTAPHPPSSLVRRSCGTNTFCWRRSRIDLASKLACAIAASCRVPTVGIAHTLRLRTGILEPSQSRGEVRKISQCQRSRRARSIRGRTAIA